MVSDVEVLQTKRIKRGKCVHCGGKIFKLLSGRRGQLYVCIMCGRNIKHKCNFECECLKSGLNLETCFEKR